MFAQVLHGAYGTKKQDFDGGHLSKSCKGRTFVIIAHKEDGHKAKLLKFRRTSSPYWIRKAV